MKPYLATMMLAGLVTATACSDQEQRPAKAPTEPAPVVRVTVDPELEPQDETQSTLVIDERIAVACQVPNAYFPFDSADIRDRSEEALKAVADCFTTGPMKRRDIALVGHADPRGTEHYNYALGQRRAGAVESVLVDQGMSADRISTTSRGELDATGTDPATWQLDRKVEVELAR